MLEAHVSCQHFHFVHNLIEFNVYVIFQLTFVFVIVKKLVLELSVSYINNMSMYIVKVCYSS